MKFIIIFFQGKTKFRSDGDPPMKKQFTNQRKEERKTAKKTKTKTKFFLSLPLFLSLFLCVRVCETKAVSLIHGGENLLKTQKPKSEF